MQVFFLTMEIFCILVLLNSSGSWLKIREDCNYIYFNINHNWSSYQSTMNSLSSYNKYALRITGTNISETDHKISQWLTATRSLYRVPKCFGNRQVMISDPFPCPKGFFWNLNLCACERIPTRPLPTDVPTCNFSRSSKWNNDFLQGVEGVLAGVNKYSLHCVKLLTARLKINTDKLRTITLNANPINSAHQYNIRSSTLKTNYDYTYNLCPLPENLEHEFCVDKDDPLPCDDGTFFNLITCTCDPL